MKKIYLNPVAHVVELEEADIVTQSPNSGMSTLSITDELDDGSEKGRERNTIWDD